MVDLRRIKTKKTSKNDKYFPMTISQHLRALDAKMMEPKKNPRLNKSLIFAMIIKENPSESKLFKTLKSCKIIKEKLDK